MSSWLSLSLPNRFKSAEDQPSDPTPAAVKDDFSVLGQTIGRQLRGVAAFLAPPPSPPSQPQLVSDESYSPSQTLRGIKNDLVEIGGSFKSSLSLLSANKAVTEISKFATNLLQFEEEAGEEAVGITDQVLEFVQEISSRPECWTDFPLTLHNDFHMSEIQIEHAASVEHYVPDLEALRHKICSELMSERRFWMIYFILLLPRLDENDATFLSTPEIIEVREMLLQKLQNKKNAPIEIPNESKSCDANNENIDAPLGTKNPSLLEKVSAEGVETSNHDNTSASVGSQKPPQNEDDVSFSDLEDEEEDSDRLSGRLSGFRSDEGNKLNSGSESNEWVRLGVSIDDRQKLGVGPSRGKDSEGEESNDWLTVDDVDF